MNTVQLTAVMDTIAHSTYFLGEHPCDVLPKTLLKNLPSMLIFNTDPSTEPGLHWAAIYINNDGVSCFFDSFVGGSKDPNFMKNIRDLLKNNYLHMQYSNKQAQDLIRYLCAAFCFFFLFFLYHVKRSRL